MKCVLKYYRMREISTSAKPVLYRSSLIVALSFLKVSWTTFNENCLEKIELDCFKQSITSSICSSCSRKICKVWAEYSSNFDGGCGVG